MGLRHTFTLVELMIVIATISIVATVTIPRYRAWQHDKRRDECRINLQSLYEAQQALYRRTGSYTADLKVLPWAPQGSPRYLYGFRNREPSRLSTTRSPQELCPSAAEPCYERDAMRRADGLELQPADLPPTHFVADQGFVVGCVGNIDGDEVLDRWTIDESGQLIHISID